MNINAKFDSGNIIVLSANSADNVCLKIRKDVRSEHAQWYYFSVQGARDQLLHLKIMNAGECSYASTWRDYHTSASYDRKNWFRVPTHYDGTVLTITHQPEHDVVYYAHYAPYTYEQHLDLINWAQLSPDCEIQDIGTSSQGRPISLLKITRNSKPLYHIWVIAGQHPGETMGGWFMEGFLQKLLLPENPISTLLLSNAVFYIVPNMNPDGTVCGNIRTNALGVDINRTWLNASLDSSPEVYCVRNHMKLQDVDFFLDVHGDEAFSYVFVSTAHQNPSFTARLKQLNEDFIAVLLKHSSDFQNEHGYSDSDIPYEISKHTASAYVADKFDCLSLTLEMPYKDNANAPDKIKGWSPERCKQLASSFLEAIAEIIPRLGKS